MWFDIFTFEYIIVFILLSYVCVSLFYFTLNPPTSKTIPSIGPILLCNLRGNVAEIAENLKSRGFVINSLLSLNHGVKSIRRTSTNAKSIFSEDSPANDSDGMYLVIVEPTPKLFQQLSVVFLKSLVAPVHSFIRLRLIEKAVATLRESTSIDGYQLLPSQDLNLKLLFAGNANQKMQEMSKYFGVKVALLYQWHIFLTFTLVVGSVLWVIVTLVGAIDFAPLLGIVFTLFCSCCIAYWRCRLEGYRQKLSVIIHIHDPDDVELALLAARLSHRGRIFNVLGSTLATCGILLVEYAIVVLYEIFVDMSKRIVSFNFTIVEDILYYWTVMSFALVVERCILFPITSFELNPTRPLAFTSFSFKKFIVKLAVFASKLLYFMLAGTSTREAERRLFTLIVCHFFTYSYLHATVFRMTDRFASGYSIDDFHGIRKKWPSVDKIKSVDLKSSGLQTSKTGGIAANIAMNPKLTDAELVAIQECLKEEFPVNRIYSDNILMLGVAMLSAPIAPIAVPLCLIVVYFSGADFLFRLTNLSRRPSLIDDDCSMEPWITIIERFSILVIVVNVLILFVRCFDVSSILEQYLTVQLQLTVRPNRLSTCLAFVMSQLNYLFGFSDSALSALFWVVIMEHGLLVIRCAVWPAVLSLGMMPASHAVVAKDRISQRDDVVEARLFQAWFLSGHVAPVTSSQKLSRAKNKAVVTLAELQTKIGIEISPYFFIGLTVVPYIIEYYQYPIWILGCFISAFCGYFYWQSSRNHAAIEDSRIGGAELKSIIRDEFPGYMYGSEMERCAWMNKMFDYTWDHLAQYGINMVMKDAGPALEKAKPPLATHLKFSTFSMGTVPPRILGIRILDAVPGRDMVEMDMDFVFNSDMEITLSLGLPLDTEFNITVADFKMSGTCRVQCLPLIPMIPPFAYGNCTFFEKPNIDFSLIIEDVDLLNIGIDVLSIRSGVRAALSFALEMAVMYPKGIKQPMVNHPEHYRKTVEQVDNGYIDGILSVNIIKCNDLIVGDITTSDPYVKLMLGDSEEETEVKYATLDPIWQNAKFNMIVTNRTEDTLAMEVWDKDVGSVGTFLGCVSVPVYTLGEGNTIRLVLKLEDVEKGIITFEVCYYPIEGKETKDEVTDNENLDISMSRLFYQERTTAPLASMSFESESDSLSNATSERRGAISTVVLGPPTGLHSNVGVSGVLTITRIAYCKVKSVKTMLQNVHYYAPYFTFTLAQVRKKTDLGPSKISSHEYRDTFSFVVSNTEQDVCQVKMKYISALGVQTTLAETEVRVIAVASAPECTLVVCEDIYKDRGAATGEFSFLAHFRSAANVVH